MGQMVRMVTTAEHQYAGHRLRNGEEYDCEPQHVELMQKRGWSRPKVLAPADTQDYQTRDMVAGASRGPRRLRK